MHLMVLRHRETAQIGLLLACIAGLLRSHCRMVALSPDRETVPRLGDYTVHIHVCLKYSILT